MGIEAVLSRRDGQGAASSVRYAVIASADRALSGRMKAAVEQLRWRVCQAGGAAEAMVAIERELPEAVILDSWLPDLEVGEFAALLEGMHPAIEILRTDGSVLNRSAKSSRRHELLTALREASGEGGKVGRAGARQGSEARVAARGLQGGGIGEGLGGAAREEQGAPGGLIGTSEPMRTLLELIRLVAPYDTTVLIEGETGTGKELVAHAIHAQSLRRDRPLVVLNCAAIPEALLEAELFGHARGAFTGAVQSRTGRIETADGGTLFLDEIGEMPLALQAKMLRFLECGELQRVGDNVVSRVDVRVIAATHQPLERRAEEGAFRLDLYHRLAVFPIDVPPLRERMEDLPALLEHLLGRSKIRAGEARVVKSLSPDALEELLHHPWPGNVRELKHVLERAVILSEGAEVIDRGHVRIRKRPRV